MAYSSLAVFSLVFSHILPPILAFIAIILVITGVIDEKNDFTLFGIALFLIAALTPFLILPFFLS